MWGESVRLYASDAQEGDRLGFGSNALDVYREYVIVGSHYYDDYNGTAYIFYNPRTYIVTIEFYFSLKFLFRLRRTKYNHPHAFDNKWQ